VVVPPRREPRRFSRGVRRAAFAVAWLGLAASIPALALAGARAVLRQDGGSVAVTVVDPSAAGYEAIVTPTPTMLVELVGPDARPSGYVVLSSNGDRGGGAVLLIPTQLRIEADEPRRRTLAEIYDQEGSAAASASIERQFRMGFRQTVSVDAGLWSALLADVGAVSFENSEDVDITPSTTEAGGPPSPLDETPQFTAGPIDLVGTEVAAFLAARNPSEDERALLYRQELFWRALMAALAARPELGAQKGPFAEFLSELARGDVQFLALPVEPIESLTAGAGDPDFVIDAEASLALIADLVPFPTSGLPGDRVKVRLLDGRADQAATLSAAVALVPAGAEVTVLGNADRFDYTATVLRYHDPELEPAVQGLAVAMGVGRIELDNQVEPGSVDVTVVVGQDFELDRSRTTP